MSRLNELHPLYNDCTLVEFFERTQETGEPDIYNKGEQGASPALLITQDSASPDLSSFISSLQGYTRDGTYHYLSENGKLWQRNQDGGWTASASNTSPFTSLSGSPDHLGGLSHYNGKLYVAAAQFTSIASNGDQQIAVYTASTLAYSAHYDVSAEMGANVTLAGLAVDPDNEIIYGSTYHDDENSGRVWKWDLTGNYLGTVDLEFQLPYTQGLAYKNGILYLAQGQFGTTLDDRPNLFMFRASDGKCVGCFILNYTTNCYFQDIEYSTSALQCANYGTVMHVRSFTPTYAPAGGPNSITLDKNANDLISVAQPFTEQGTVLMRVKFRTLFDYNSIVDQSENANNWEGWAYADGKIAFRVSAAQTALSSAGAVSAGVWYDIGMSWLKSGANVTAKIIKNSVVLATSTSTTYQTPSSRGWWIGGGNTGNTKGDLEIEYFAVFDRQLSTAEIGSVHRNPRALVALPRPRSLFTLAAAAAEVGYIPFPAYGMAGGHQSLSGGMQ